MRPHEFAADDGIGLIMAPKQTWTFDLRHWLGAALAVQSKGTHTEHRFAGHRRFQPSGPLKPPIISAQLLGPVTGAAVRPLGCR